MHHAGFILSVGCRRGEVVNRMGKQHHTFIKHKYALLDLCKIIRLIVQFLMRYRFNSLTKGHLIFCSLAQHYSNDTLSALELLETQCYKHVDTSCKSQITVPRYHGAYSFKPIHYFFLHFSILPDANCFEGNLSTVINVPLYSLHFLTAGLQRLTETGYYKMTQA